MEEGILAELDRIAAEFEGRICLAARDMRTGEHILYHADSRCPTASVIKLPILIHTLLLASEGAVSLDQTLILRDGDARPGSGILKELTPGLRVTLRDACMLMIALSDNTATNMVLDVVGVEPVNERMARLGCRQTRLFRKVFAEGPPVSRENARYGLGVTTPRDMLRLLTALYRGRIGSPELSASVRSFLGAQQYHDAIPRYLPPQWRYEGKGGAVDAVRNDVGFVTAPDGHTIALAVFCNRMPRPLWTADNPGLIAIARCARAVCEHFHPTLGSEGVSPQEGGRPTRAGRPPRGILS